MYKTQVKVGIFTVVVLAVLVLGYLWLSSRISTTAQRELKISFEDVTGLEIGDKVNFRGMEIGRVKKIQSRAEDILLTASIDSAIRLKEGARFYISDSSLMGGRVLNIAQGQGEGMIDLDLVQSGESPAGLMSIVSKAATTIDDINAVLRDLRKDGGLIDKSSVLLDNADSAARSVDALALDVKSEIRATLDRVEELTGQLNQIVAANRDKVNSVLDSAPEAMLKASATLDSLRSVSNRLGTALETLNSGTGTASRLMNEDELYVRLLDSVAELDTLVKEIRANPKKYLKISVF